MTLDKTKLREFALKKRKELSSSGATKINSSRIVNKIINSSDFINASHIAIYMPINNEADITSLLNVPDKKFYIPKCNNNNLEFTPYDKNYLKQGKFGILECEMKSINPDILDVIYIPCLMANKNCYRLGWGRGYYDRFFAKNNIKAKKIIVVFSDLISDSFVQDKFDFKCDSLLSEV